MIAVKVHTVINRRVEDVFVLYTRLGRQVRRDTQTGKHFLPGSLNSISWTDDTVGFVIAVTWDQDIDKDCVEYFVVTSEEGQVLDQIPRIANRLKQLPANVSAAIVYAAFPRPGQYRIDVYQNDTGTHTIPLSVVEHRCLFGLVWVVNLRNRLSNKECSVQGEGGTLKRSILIVPLFSKRLWI